MVMDSHIGNQESDHITNQGGIAHIKDPRMVLLWLMMPTCLSPLSTTIHLDLLMQTTFSDHAISVTMSFESKHAILEEGLKRLSCKEGLCKTQKENNSQVSGNS